MQSRVSECGEAISTRAVISSQVTWPAYFVELVRALEDQRRREEDRALAELDGESDGILSDEESNSSSDEGSRTSPSDDAGALQS